MDRLRRSLRQVVHRHPVPLLLAVMAYAPMLATSPGKVSADTKSYLTLDPARLLSRAISMWDPSVGAGTVTHQNIGFLFPLGPYYWTMERLGVPDWIAQRLLWGTLVFAAAFGTWRLLRWMGWASAPTAVAAVAYGWSPYLFSYLARLSVILGPWAAMPWLILFAARAVRSGGWRHPAWFALCVALVGSSNATSLLLVLIGPALWVSVELINREVAWRAVLTAAARTGVLSVGVSLWWIAGLGVQGAYGIPILRYTETYETVARASTPAELIRGLGYWFFYGGDKLDQWVGPSKPYFSNPPLMTLGFTLAGVALLGLFVAFRGRRQAGALVVVGLAVSAGAAPWPGGSLYGRMFKAFTDTTSGMAMRSTPRAVPVLLLGLAMGLGGAGQWAAQQVRRRRGTRRSGRATYAVLGVLLAVQALPWFTLRALTPSLLRGETLPGYERDLAAWLDGHGTGRVWEVPGSDFGNYRWGGTVDPALPGLIDRPYLARELVPQGGPATVNLLNAIDRRMQEGWFEPSSLAPIARLFGVGTVVARNDIEYERYRLARPAFLDVDLRAALGEPAFQGPVIPDATRVAMLDPTFYARPDAPPSYPAVAAYNLDPSEPLVVSQDAAHPVVLVGDGEGVVDLAAAGLIDGARPIVYAASDAAVARRLAALDGAWIVVTDTNRKQGQRWSSVGSNQGALEPPGPPAVVDDRDNPVDLFPNQTDADRTVLAPQGDLAAVWATGYGNRITYTPEDAAAFAVDGDTATAWRGAAFEASTGLALHLSLTRPVSADHVTVVQPQRGVVDRYITGARLILRRGGTVVRTIDVALTPASRTAAGQRIDVPEGTAFDSVVFEVRSDNMGERSSYAAIPAVGLAELSIPGVTMATAVLMPSDLLAAAGDLRHRRVTLVMTRQRIAPGTPNRFDPEPRLQRQFVLPAPMSLELSGSARLAATADDRTIEQVIGGSSIIASANRRMDGAPLLGGRAAIDGDRSTAWTTPLDGAAGSELTITTPTAQAGRRWRLLLASGPTYSTITALSIRLANGTWAPLRLPAGDPLVTLPAGTGSSVTVRIDAVDPAYATGYFDGDREELPAGIVELTPLDPPTTPTTPAATAGTLGTCRADLLRVDGAPVRVRLTGSPDDALTRQALALSLCDGPLRLDAGAHTIDSAAGLATGIDVDRLILDNGVAAPAGPTAAVEVGSSAATRITGTVPASTTDQYLVLRQSWNAGWRLSVDGHDLGPSALIDGYANGWVVPPGAAARPFVLQWTPQRRVDLALMLSAVALVAVAALILGARRRPEGDWRTVAPAPRWLLPATVTVAFVVGSWGGLAGALAAVALARRRPALAPVACVAAGAAASGWIVLSQIRHRYPAGAFWPDLFAVVNPLVWFAVAVATTAAITGTAGRHSRAAADGQPPPTPS
ncbi:MAG: alpha-(1-_3)-arabinofuranosyltransferase family protein [Ilumatobacteraceae bacterium]